MTPAQRQLIDLAAAKGRAGFTTREVPGRTVRQAEDCAKHLVTKGLLHKAKLGARTIRYFATAAMAEQFLQGRRVSETHRSGYRFAPDAKVVWPKGVKVKVIPPAERPDDMPIRTGFYEPF